MNTQAALNRELRKLGYSKREADILSEPPTDFHLYLAWKYSDPIKQAEQIADLFIVNAPKVGG